MTKILCSVGDSAWKISLRYLYKNSSYQDVTSCKLFVISVIIDIFLNYKVITKLINSLKKTPWYEHLWRADLLKVKQYDNQQKHLLPLNQGWIMNLFGNGHILWNWKTSTQYTDYTQMQTNQEFNEKALLLHSADLQECSLAHVPGQMTAG